MAGPQVCPKCRRPLPEGAADPDAGPRDLQFACEFNQLDGCPYVQCDDLTCRALKVPEISRGVFELDALITEIAHARDPSGAQIAALVEAAVRWRATALHYATHQLLGGCSHGR